MLTDVRIEMLKREFEAKGPDRVKEDLARDSYGPDDSPDVKLAEAFLEKCEAEEKRAHRESESARGGKALALAEEANEIAREASSAAIEANRIARNAKTWSRWTVIIAVFVFLMQLIRWWLTPSS